MTSPLGRFRLGRLRLLATVGLAALAAWGCENQAVVAVAVAGVEVEPSEETLWTGQSLQLSATPLDPAGAPLERDVVWTSDDESVVSVNPEGGVEGRNPGSTRVVAMSGGAEGHALIHVSPPPRIAASPATVEFTATEGGGVAEARQVSIENEGSGSLEGLSASVSYANEQGWLDVTLQETTAPAVAVLRATAEALPPGEHRATVQLVAPHADNSPVAVQVVFRVERRAPALRLSTSASGFVWEQGRAGPPSQTVTVRSDGSRISGLERSIRYENEPDGWLSADLSGRSTPADLTLRAFPQALSPGRYEATVVLRSPDAGSTAELRVRLTVAEPPPDPVRITDLDFRTSGFLGRHLHVTLALETEKGDPVPGAEVTIEIRNTDRAQSWTRAGRTGADGAVTLDLENHPTGCYRIVVLEVEAAGTAWDGRTPEHRYCRSWSFL